MKPQVKRVVAWHPVLTDHQAYTYQELSRLINLPVIVQVAKLEDQTRRDQGWTDTRVTSVERQQIPTKKFISYGLSYLLKNRDQVHIFGSAFENPRMMLLLWLATCLRLDCYIISEPYSPVSYGYFADNGAIAERVKTFLRPMLYRIYIRALRRGLKGIFAISSLAVRQYEDAGMPRDRLFPFGYFVPSVLLADCGSDENVSSIKLRMVFIGSLISRKGLSTLMGAVKCALAKGASLQLDVYGHGDISKFEFDEISIQYKGVIPFGEAQKFLKAYDLLVLPSFYDGWGVVVNEALCANVPVLCSDQVGARTLIETFNAGKVFPCGDMNALADLLISLANDPARIQKMRLACGDAAKAIQPVRAAAYMLQVLSTESTERADIASPWYETA